MAAILRMTLADPGIPISVKSPENWPAAAQAEWGSDQGVAAASIHRAALVEQFRKVRNGA